MTIRYTDSDIRYLLSKLRAILKEYNIKDVNDVVDKMYDEHEKLKRDKSIFKGE